MSSSRCPPERLAELQKQEAALEAAMRSGVAEIQIDGRSVKYRDMGELRRALGDVRRELAFCQGRARPRRFILGTGRGY